MMLRAFRLGGCDVLRLTAADGRNLGMSPSAFVGYVRGINGEPS